MSLLRCLIETDSRTDKYDLGYIEEFYDRLFTPIQNSAEKILEIGIYQGQSIKLWHSYFNKATVYAADVVPYQEIEQYPRVRALYGNAYDLNFFKNFEKNTFDIVIDDGPHTYESMVFFLTHYIDLIKPGGYCILEDIIDRTWTPLLINLIKHRKDIEFSVYDMRFKQRNEYLYDLWKHGLDVIVIQKL